MRTLALIGLLLFGDCMKKNDHDQWLVLGGTHELGKDSCTLGKVQPEGALEDLKWVGGNLVVRAKAEGTAELTCGTDRTPLHVARPASLHVTVDGGAVKAGAHFQVRVGPKDASGRALEIGKWTQVEWSSEGDVASDNDPSAGEFGLCDTCFGQQGFRAGGKGKVKVRASFGGLTGELEVPIL